MAEVAEQDEKALKEQAFAQVVDEFVEGVYRDNEAKGFWKKYYQTREKLQDTPELLEEYERTFKAQRIALMHSELSEGLEGIRKDLQDDKLPDVPMDQAELADTVIRIFDYAGRWNIPLGTVIARKLAYNRGREYMHGKKF